MNAIGSRKHRFDATAANTLIWYHQGSENASEFVHS